MENDIKNKALDFAIKAHSGQVRKNERDKPMIIHPISVGKILQDYGYDDNVVAAGFLHDVVEDTKYTIDDIKNLFGDDIASLVMGASEPDKALSWEERKTHTIKTIKELSLRHKVVVCADKINNLEDILLSFEKSGERDFSNFKRGEEKQKWYYNSVYESLITNEDENIPIFKRLKEVLDKLFSEEKDDDYYTKFIFSDNLEYYEQLKVLHAMKKELKNLKELANSKKPFVIEFSGTPRTGKTTIINNLHDFFSKGGFDVRVVEEFTTSHLYKEVLKEKLSKLDSADKYITIIDTVYNQLNEALSNCTNDIILIDRSINDRQIWNYTCFQKGEMNEVTYNELRVKYKDLSRKLIDYLVVTYANSTTALKRDYNSHLSLEKRSFLNIDNLIRYNQSLFDMRSLLSGNTNGFSLIDTINIDINEESIIASKGIMKSMRKKYIKDFKDNYHIK